MEIKGIKINIVILVIVGILILYFGVQYYNNIYRIEQPLENKLANLNGVEEVNLLSENDKITIDLKFNTNTAIYNTYIQTEKITENILRNEEYEITINNKLNKNLEQIYYDIHFHLYEGAVIGKFTNMIYEIDDIMIEHDFQNYNIYIDNNNIYMELVEKDNYYFKIISYQKNTTHYSGQSLEEYNNIGPGGEQNA